MKEYLLPPPHPVKKVRRPTKDLKKRIKIRVYEKFEKRRLNEGSQIKSLKTKI
jgi:hypothetical protein